MTREILNNEGKLVSVQTIITKFSKYKKVMANKAVEVIVDSYKSGINYFNVEGDIISDIVSHPRLRQYAISFEQSKNRDVYNMITIKVN